MTRGRALALLLLACGLAAGVAIYWLQVYGYYRKLSPAEAADQRVTLADGSVVALPVTAAEAIDADSSPLRYRACLTLAPGAAEPSALMPYPGAAVPVTPGWFSCFDDGALADAALTGALPMAMAEANRPWGVDRVIAFEGARAFVWPQLNRCGKALFSGEPLPDGCPPPPES